APRSVARGRERHGRWARPARAGAAPGAGQAAAYVVPLPREQPLAAASFEQRVDAVANVRRQCRMALPQPLQALPLIGEGLLGPGTTIDGAFDTRGAAAERIRVHPGHDPRRDGD